MATVVSFTKTAHICCQSLICRKICRRTQSLQSETVCAYKPGGQQLKLIKQRLSYICIWSVPFLGSTLQAAAEEGAQYDPEQGSEVIKNISGVAYTALVAFFLFRLFKRRASKAKSQRIAKQQGGDQEIEDEPIVTSEMLTKDSNDAVPESQATPLSSLFGAVQAGGIAFLLYLAANSIDSTLGMADLPDQYTARNIAVSVRTVIRGLVWLATFIFGANSLGLLLLTFQLIVDPEGKWEKRGIEAEIKKQELPKISLTSDPSEVKRAFEQAAKIEDD
eukprot:TRINITY_DN4014_c0_g1_i1.p1 TRINITY_DN4014_c0_g1~~TRINITY_DN4014_c0_g1_i1.p1  ORF type:complete len:297 (-),score=39.32 TRINITY_DN4014_c0_g1_i1:492-1322(-)